MKQVFIVEDYLVDKTSKYHELVLATEIIFCYNPKCRIKRFFGQGN